MRLRERSGTTLLEVSIASVIFVTLGTVLLQLYQASFQGFSTINAQGALRMQLAQALNAISVDAQEARQQLASGCNGLVAGPTTLLLQVPSIDTATQQILQGTYDEICYTYLPDPDYELRRIVKAAPGTRRATELSPRTVARHISLVSFSLPATNLIQVTLAAQKTEGGRLYAEPRENGTLSVQFALRNRPH